MNTAKPGLFSICLLGYNHAPFIAKNLQAFWQCNWPAVEIIVLDDGSKDNSRQILQELAEKSPVPIKLILQENAGNIAKNFNTLLRHAEGEFIQFMALDDMPNPAGVQEALARLQNTPTDAFVFSEQTPLINERGEEQGFSPFKLHEGEQATPQNMLELEYNHLHSFFIQNAVFRKSAVAAVGGFDEDQTGDDIILRTKLFRMLEGNPNMRFEIIKTPLCHYRIHENNIHKNRLRQIKTATEYLERYWPQRPNPAVLIEWAKDLIQNEPYEKTFEMFALNKRCGQLILNKELQTALITKITREHSPWHFIYKKEKNCKQRTITLFSCLRFSYTHKS
uniref:Glycosyltransferase 2-like domain-containing protein n=1 Tax=uncultured Elusimicrobia bacterium TaxID=699876 RepID=A0A650EMZ7_9BACT|nr:hypothetical protein Elusimicrob1349_1610 [uncultured Elusimicrobia bacterium]